MLLLNLEEIIRSLRRLINATSIMCALGFALLNYGDILEEYESTITDHT